MQTWQLNTQRSRVGNNEATLNNQATLHSESRINEATTMKPRPAVLRMNGQTKGKVGAPYKQTRSRQAASPARRQSR